MINAPNTASHLSIYLYRQVWHAVGETVPYNSTPKSFEDDRSVPHSLSWKKKLLKLQILKFKFCLTDFTTSGH